MQFVSFTQVLPFFYQSVLEEEKLGQLEKLLTKTHLLRNCLHVL